jgi:hypothetical protein
MTERTVLLRLMYIPELLWTCLRGLLKIGVDKLFLQLFLPQGRNPVKEECQSVITLNLITAYNKYSKKDEQH